MKTEMPKFMTVNEVAALAKCSVRHIHEEKKRGVLLCRKAGRRLLFSESDVLKWLNRKTQVA